MTQPRPRSLTPPMQLVAIGGMLLAGCRSAPQPAPVAVTESGRNRTPAALPATAAPPAAVPSRGDTAEYTVLMGGRAAGRLRQWPDSGGTVTTSYAYSDRGRGPSLTQTLRTDKAGLPVGMLLSGTNYLAQPVREMVQVAGPLLTWRNENAAGRTAPGTAYYLPLEQLPSDVAALARALQLSKSRSLPLLPEGQVTATIGAARVFSAAARSMRVTPVVIAGLGLTPETVWLDGEGRLFASGGPGFLVIRSGYEGTADEIVAAQLASSRVRDSLTAIRLARTPRRGIAIIHANLFDAAARRMKPAQTVIVRGETIEAVGDDGTVPLPANVEIVDARGRALLPGLWDMHVHVQDDDGLLHLAAGVTTVRDLASDTGALAARVARFSAGSLLGPRVLRAGIIDGPGPYAGPTPVLVANRDAARVAVESYANAGYEQVKVYSSLDPSLFQTIVRTAHQRGLRVSGHAPNGMTAEQMVRAGADELQHANFLFLNFLTDSVVDTRTPARFTAVGRRAASVDLRSEAVQRFIALLKEKDVVVDPTLNVFERLYTARVGTLDQASLPVATRMPAVARRALLAGGLPAGAALEQQYRASFIAMERMVKRLHDAGVRLVAGTDGQAGFALHRELELFAEAGIPNVDILYLATLGASRVMKHEARWGSIEPGKLADLVLVDGDPSQRMRDLRRMELVMKGGVLYVPDSLYASIGVKPAPRKGAIPTREVRAEDVVCRGPAAVVRRGTTGPVPLNCSVVDSTSAAGRSRARPAPRPAPRRTPPKRTVRP
ncbi:MAG: amidohydrolase family protein [Gemmatimonadaceae bacterium]|nr:amidohydrolase family protein [Gemmatimonadaceae bacterium]